MIRDEVYCIGKLGIKMSVTQFAPALTSCLNISTTIGWIAVKSGALPQFMVCDQVPTKHSH